MDSPERGRRRHRLDVDALTVIAGSAFVAFALVGAVRSPVWTDPAAWPVVAVFAAVMLVTEIFRITSWGHDEASPLTVAASYAFAVTAASPGDVPMTYGSSVVVTVTAGALAAGAVLRHRLGMTISFVNIIGRLCGVAVVAWLYRGLDLGGGTLLAFDLRTGERWLVAAVMIACSGMGLAVDTTTRAVLTGLRHPGPWRRRLVDTYRSSLGLATAMSATGALIALAERPLGVLAVPLFLIPLMLTQFAIRRADGVRATHRQSVRALSRLSELGGYTPVGHSDRVAAVAVEIARHLGLPERQCADLESAAHLHDIGQVALVEPIPRGATSAAAPGDQQRIADDSARIVAESGVAEAVRAIVRAQAVQYRQVREFGQDIPLGARILKVANAYDDFVGDAAGADVDARALERLVLGMGYEYDPRVVDALAAVVPRKSR